MPFEERLQFIVEAFGIERVKRQLRGIQKDTAVFRKELEVMTKNVGLQNMEKAFKGITDKKFFETLGTDTQELSRNLSSMAEESGMPEFVQMFEDIKTKSNLRDILKTQDVERVRESLSGIGEEGSGSMDSFGDSAKGVMKRIPGLEKLGVGSFTKIAGAAGVLGIAVGGVLAGVGLLQKAWGLLFRSSSVLQTVFGAVNDIFFAFVDSIVATLMPVLGPLIAMFAEMAANVLPRLLPFFENLADTIAKYLMPVLDFLQPGFERLLELFGLIIGLALHNAVALVGVALTVLGSVLYVIEPLMGAIIRIVEGMVEGLIIFYTTIADTIIETGLFEKVLGALHDVIEALMAPDMVDAFVQLIKDIAAVGADLAVAFIDFVGDILPDLIDLIPDLLSVGSELLDFFSDLGEEGDLRTMFEDIFGAITGVIDLIPSLISRGEDMIRTFVNFFNKLVDPLNILIAAYNILNALAIAAGVRPHIEPLEPIGLQYGGIVTSPTLALIGEAGPELVVPIENLRHIEESFLKSIERIETVTPMPMQAGGIVTKPTLAVIGERGPELVLPIGKTATSSSSEMLSSVLQSVEQATVSESVESLRENIENFESVSAASSVIQSMQEGGIVTKAAAVLIGEKGPELVLPLERLRDTDVQSSIISSTDSVGTLVERLARDETVSTASQTITNMQEGGIVTSPTIALLGEKGPELVVPIGMESVTSSSNVFESRSGSVDSFVKSFEKVESAVPITAMQAGGVVMSSSLIMAGERGPEAIIPLREAGIGPTGGMELLEELIDQLLNISAPNQTIQLVVDGKVLAEIVSEHQRRGGQTTLRSVI